MNLEGLIKKYNNIDIAELDEYKMITVGETESQETYKDLVVVLKEYDSKVFIANGIVGEATKEEFLEAEKIIQKVVDNINPNWSKLQKAAFVHYEMGKLISYSPDFNYRGRYCNSQVSQSTRNIWKSVLEEESVCNGIVSIMRNILARVSVETKELSTETHSFLLVETEDGNIIADPTWDLANSLFNARPMYFGKKYEQLRNDEEGLSNAHKLEHPPENVIELNDNELRELYHSLGYTKEDRTFVFPILDKVMEIQDTNVDIKTKFNQILNMFTQDFSRETKHLSETRTFLEKCIREIGIDRRDITTKFVYSKEDKEYSKPYLSLFVNNEQIGKNMEVLNLDEMSFNNLEIEEFDKRYNVHELDTSEPFWKKYLQKEEIKEKDKQIEK